MINLTPILASQFPAYRSYFVSDYSQELIQNYGYSLATATEIAEKELQRCFPNGVSTQEHQLMCITHADDDSWLGYLWYNINSETSMAFIYDLYIAPDFRNFGYGSQALAQLEHHLKPQGIYELKLRVAYTNDSARKLYQRLGFTITGYNMCKNL